MCESYSRSLLRVSVAQICQALGWDSVQLSACHLLTDVLQRYLQQLGRGCHRYSELYGRTDPILDDVGEAFQLMGVSLHELEDYIHNIEPVTFPHQIPAFPVSKNNVLQFPQPGSKDAEERKEYIPDYLPPIVSSQEEEEEEPVPTDGGTSAEAMQVPLEADDELEEEEVVNDENFLGKRPLGSPDAEEPPAVKRPRLLSAKGDALDAGPPEAREPLSSINTQKIPPLLSPAHVPDGGGPAPASPEPPTLAPVAKPPLPAAKPSETKAPAPKAKTKTASPGQKAKSPKGPQAPAMVGSPLRSPKMTSKEKKSPGRSKSPRSPKSPKAVSHVPQTPVRPETPNRTLSATAGEKTSKEAPAAAHAHLPPDAARPGAENPPRKAPVTDKTIDDSIDAVIARACAEREPDPFEFSSGSESEGDTFTSPRRIAGPECVAPKAAAANTFAKAGPTPLPPASGTSSSDNSWTMDASIDEVVRKAKMGTAPGAPPSFPYLSSPSVSPPTPEPPHKLYDERSKPPSSADVKKKLKKELKTKMKKKEKQRDRERERDKGKDKGREKDRGKEKEKDKDASKESKNPWKEFLRDEESDPYKFKIKDFEDVDPKVRLKDGLARKEKEKHKDKKKDREKGKKEKEKRDKDRVKEKGREDKVKVAPAPLVLPPKDVALSLITAARVPASLPSLSPMLSEKLFEEKEKPKEKERKKDKKEKKKKKEKEKEKEKKEKEREKEKRERERREKEKEKHKHEKIKVEPAVPAPSPVIPRLTLRVGAGQDKIVISKVVPAPEPKAASSLNRPKTPPPAPASAPGPVHVTPPPVPLPLLAQAAVSPALLASPSAAVSGAGSSKGPVRSVVTETVSTYVIRDEWGNQIWICPGCDKPDDGSPMIGCDDCDDWYHWPCVGLTTAPPEEMQWFCPKCASKKKDKKHKKRKHRAH